MTRRGSVLIGAVAGAMAVMLVGGIAWAAIPGAGGVIQGCYKANNGQLRVVGSQADCNPSELALTWNQQGAPGLPGTNGTNGADGVSVTSDLEPAGFNCAAGGTKFTAATGVTYA